MKYYKTTLYNENVQQNLATCQVSDYKAVQNIQNLKPDFGFNFPFKWPMTMKLVKMKLNMIVVSCMNILRENKNFFPILNKSYNFL